MVLAFAALFSGSLQSSPDGRITLRSRDNRIEMTLDLDHKCVVSDLKIAGRLVGSTGRAATSGIKIGDAWITTAELATSPKMVLDGKSIQITGIRFGNEKTKVAENWTFTTGADSIQWKIDRRYLAGGILADSSSPIWSFRAMDTWTGALLGTGGVAWCKLFDSTNATYGVHTDSASLWNTGNDSMLELTSEQAFGRPMALRFTRQPSNEFTLAFAPTPHPLLTKHVQARYLRDGQDVWMPWRVDELDHSSVTYTLRAPRYSPTANRGVLKGVDGNSVREILNTIGRIGVIDDKLIGSNGWYSGYAVYHEPWVAQMGLAIDDPKFTANMSRAINYERDNGIEPDGLVKSRWTYDAGDAIPGTFEPTGFYECQWGRLMDSQTSYVINAAQQFDLTGDTGWLRGQKSACEAALDYLLRRDTNGNHLVEVASDTWRQHKSSDWLDVVWASFESAFVNAQLYRALSNWAENELLLGDAKRAGYYREYAAKLKASFNKPLEQGGFWDANKKWYAYWREKDGSVHGDNLVLPINFMAIAYGLCDQPQRKAAILSHIEQKMAEQKLFCWPANIYPYAPNDTGNPEFPTYENGDIFLAWAETGIAAYADYDLNIALKYVRNILNQYRKDGLAFQRYLRRSQTGTGDDILANNCNAMVGLYRDIYGIQPKYNRLFLKPRITSDLNGTTLNYRLRDQLLHVGLSIHSYSIGVGNQTIHCSEDFGAAISTGRLAYFHGEDSNPSLVVEGTGTAKVNLTIQSWKSTKRWVLSGATSQVKIKVNGLVPFKRYRIAIGAKTIVSETASLSGQVSFSTVGDKTANFNYVLTLA